MSARTQPFMLTLVVAGFLGAAAVRGNLQSAIPRRSSVALHLALLLVYALASAAWGMDPPGTLLAVALAMLVALGTIALMQLFAEEPLGNLLHMGEGVWAAYVVGLLYLLIEIASDQSIKLWLYNLIGLGQPDLPHPGFYEWSGGRLVAISDEEIKRNIAPLTLFLWPAVLAALGTFTLAERPRGGHRHRRSRRHRGDARNARYLQARLRRRASRLCDRFIRAAAGGAGGRARVGHRLRRCAAGGADRAPP